MKNISLNFGSIKDTIYKHSSKNIISEGEMTNFVNLFVNELAKKPILKVQYLIYKNIESAKFKESFLAERYLKQNLSLIEGFDWNKILIENKDFRFKMLINKHVESDAVYSNLHESIHTLIKSTTSKGFHDFNDENQAYHNVINYLLREDSAQEPVTSEYEEFPKLLSWKYITEIAVNNFNKRYEHLNEDEKQLVKILLSDEDSKNNHFKDLKEGNLSLLDKLISEEKDNNELETLNKFKTKILTINQKEGLNESIINLFELKQTLEN